MLNKQFRASYEVVARRQSQKRRARKRKTARATARKTKQSPMRKSMNCVTTLIAHSTRQIVFTARKKTIRCLPYRVDHWNRKSSQGKSHQRTELSQHQRLLLHQLSVTQCQRQRPKSTKTSIQLNHRLIHGTRMDRHRKVSSLALALWFGTSVLSLIPLQAISTRVPTAKARKRWRERFVWRSSHSTTAQRPSPRLWTNFVQPLRISRCLPSVLCR